MNQGVGRSAEGHQHLDGVVENAFAEDVTGFQVFPYHIDNATARVRRHARMIRIRCRNCRRVWKAEAECFGDAGHRRCGAHGHTCPRRAGNPFFYFAPVVLVDISGTQLVPVFPHVRTRSQGLALPVAAQHWSGRHEDRGQIHADCAHHQAGHGLVAPAHQYTAVSWIGSQKLLGFHCE